ncbi:MAG: hypothetical protein ACI83P_000500 [Janthinobacterium sp.]|jgi:hypothetical protein
MVKYIAKYNAKYIAKYIAQQDPLQPARGRHGFLLLALIF